MTASARRNGARRPTTSPTRPAVGTADPASADAPQVQALLAVIERFLAPGTVLVALAYHFGREYTVTRAEYFGLDASLLELSTQDYVQRSIDPLFLPVGTLILCALLALALHRFVRRLLAVAAARRPLLALSAVLVIAGALALAFGVRGYFSRVPAWSEALVSLAPGLGLVLLVSGVSLARELLQPPDRRGLSTGSNALRVLVGSFLVLNLFWAASEYASALGRGRSATLAADLHALPAVTVLTAQSLQLSEPGVSEVVLPETDGAYRYRYDGLRFLLKADDSLILIPAGWRQDDGSILILESSEDLRFEFDPPRG